MGLLVLMLMVTLSVMAQEAQQTEEEAPPPPRFMRGPRVVSPEIHPDNTVTFRFLAPDADTVRVNGDWEGGRGIQSSRSA